MLYVGQSEMYCYSDKTDLSILYGVLSLANGIQLYHTRHKCLTNIIHWAAALSLSSITGIVKSDSG